MSHTSAASVTVPRPSRTGRQGFTRALLAAVGTFAMLLASARTANAQAPPQQPAAWEFRVESGALVPMGVQRDVLENAALTVAQVSYVMRPPFVITSSFGWARSRDLASAGAAKLDVFTYDLGAEARAPQWPVGRAVTLSAFAGAGAGARSYNYRKLDFDATHNVGGYGSVGGEFGIRRVHLRVEVRDYVAGFKPLVGGGHGDPRNDVVVIAGLGFSK